MKATQSLFRTLLVLLFLAAGQNAWAQETIGSIQYNEPLGAYEINSADHLHELAMYVRDGHSCADLVFKMTADITIPHTTAWNDDSSTEQNYDPIGEAYSFKGPDGKAKTGYLPFSGTFDGQGYTISGIRIYSDDSHSLCKGIFGHVENGTVQNVTVADARFTGVTRIGGIVGETVGASVTNCQAASTVALRAIRNKASSFGGIVGCSSQKYSSSSASTVSSCTSAAVFSLGGTVQASDCAGFGGIVGTNNDNCTISYCTAAGVILPYLSVDAGGAGVIVGLNKDGGILTGNIYHSCLMDGTYAFNIGTGTGDVSGATLVTNKLFLYDNRNNSKLTTAYAKPYARNNSSTAHGATYPNVSWVDLTLKGRTFYKDGTWNTLSLPFDVSSLSNTPLSGATIMTLDTDNSTYNSGTGALTVAFKSASSIAKKTPYIVKWTSGSNVTDPTFKDVNAGDLSTFTQTVTAGLVKFSSNLAPLSSIEGKLFDAHNADNRGYHSYITIAAPETPEGFSFSGWYADDAFTTPVTNTIPFGPDGTFSLYARQFGNTPTLTGHLYEGRYWATFYHRTLRYTLPSGATAYTMGTDHQLYRLGTDGRTIPAGVAVVIIATSADVSLSFDSSTVPVADHAPNGGNILQGVDTPTAVSGTPYVLGIVNGVLGFYEYTGGPVPAHKAYYTE